MDLLYQLEKKCQNEKLPIIKDRSREVSILISGDCGIVIAMHNVGMNIATLLNEKSLDHIGFQINNYKR